jgi:hypothetical protein
VRASGFRSPGSILQMTSAGPPSHCVPSQHGQRGNPSLRGLRVGCAQRKNLPFRGAARMADFF